MKILLVEDEKLLSDAIAKGLKKLSYAVDKAYDGEEALALLEVNQYDLIILDVNLPGISGLEVISYIRKMDKLLKVLILSAKGEVEDKIVGLDLGANDYLSKPFDFNELAARIRNLIRWSFSKDDTVMSMGLISVDTAQKIVKVDNKVIELTNKEYGLLEYFISNKDRVISAEELIEHVWDSEIDLFSNTFKFHIHSLKKKIPVKGIIKNIRGQGYMISEVDSDD